MELQTERLVIREWREGDVDHYITLSKDVGYNCFSLPGYFLVKDAAEARERVQERIGLFRARKLGKFPIFLRGTGEFAGTCGLAVYRLEGHEEVELGYRLCLKHWSQGYAREAAAAVLRYGFGDLKLEKIIAFAVPQNRASLKIVEALGFVYQREIIHAELVHRLYDFSRKNFVNRELSAE